MTCSTERVRRHRFREKEAKRMKLLDKQDSSAKVGDQTNLLLSSFIDNTEQDSLCNEEDSQSGNNSEAQNDTHKCEHNSESENDSQSKNDESQSSDSEKSILSFNEWLHEQENDVVSDSEHSSSGESIALKDFVNKFRDEEPEITSLRKWYVQCRIPRVHVDSFLKILRQRLLPTLPASYKTFLRTTAAKYSIETIQDSNDEPAEFAYLGIEAGLQSCVNPLRSSST